MLNYPANPRRHHRLQQPIRKHQSRNRRPRPLASPDIHRDRIQVHAPRQSPEPTRPNHQGGQQRCAAIRRSGHNMQPPNSPAAPTSALPPHPSRASLLAAITIRPQTPPTLKPAEESTQSSGSPDRPASRTTWSNKPSSSPTTTHTRPSTKHSPPPAESIDDRPTAPPETRRLRRHCLIRLNRTPHQHPQRNPSQPKQRADEKWRPPLCKPSHQNRRPTCAHRNPHLSQSRAQRSILRLQINRIQLPRRRNSRRFPQP